MMLEGTEAIAVIAQPPSLLHSRFLCRHATFLFPKIGCIAD